MRIAFDIGGMSTKIAVVDNGKIIKKDEILYPNYTNGLDLLKQIKEKLNLYVKDYKFTDICISACGIINSSTGDISGLSAVKNFELVNFKKDLKEYDLPVYVENDANCAALYEHHFGSAKGFKDVAFVVIGTGIGGAVIINGNLHKGKNLLGGEFGCMIEDIKGEQYINTSLSASAKTISELYNKEKNTNISTKEVFELYDNDKVAKKIIDAVIFSAAKMIVNISFVIDPELFVIGGGISKNNLYIKNINLECKRLYEKLNIPKHFNVVAAKGFNDANLLGAYILPEIK
ncbi:ROK family protein [Spiroplasma endosymbiont of Anurida maritima]|uniref:ROK family protein n=1 Tax=Spiroplasma endosymbiont of Anurida maritima TaxID=2967972 RepID=UPI0036D3001F